MARRYRFAGEQERGAPAFASIRPKSIRKLKRQQKESSEPDWQLAAEDGGEKSEVREREE